jgi:hypothetical protein
MNKADLAAGKPEAFENDLYDENTRKELEALEKDIYEAEKILESKKKKMVELLGSKVAQQTV